MVSWKYRGVLLAVLLLSCVAAPTSAQMRANRRPLMVKFIGVFQPYDKQAAGALHTLTVAHGEQSWLFNVERTNIVGGGQDPGTMLLNRIVPPRLSISGPPAFLESLKNPATMGKRFALQGWLDVRVRSLRVVEVNEEPADPPAPGR